MGDTPRRSLYLRRSRRLEGKIGDDVRSDGVMSDDVMGDDVKGDDVRGNGVKGDDVRSDGGGVARGGRETGADGEFFDLRGGRWL